MIANRVHDVGAAVDDVHDAGRQPALREQLGHLALRERHLLGRLQHERIAGDDRERQEPHRHHRRKVERRDGGAHAQRLSHDVAVDSGRDVLERRALHQRGRTAGHLDALDAAPDAAPRFVERLAVLRGDSPRQLVEVLFHQRFELVEHLRPGIDGRVTPRGKRTRSRLNGGIDIDGRGQRRATDQFADGRVPYLEKIVRVCGDPASADEVVERCDVSMSLHI